MEISSEYTILTEAEYTRFFGQAPRAKDPKVPKIWVRGSSGTPELVFAFKKADAVGRQMKLVSRLSDVHAEEIMSKEHHLHQHQGERTWQHSFQTQMQQSQIDQMLSPNGALCTLQEYEGKLAKKRSDASSSAAACTAFSDAGMEGGSAVVIDDNDEMSEDEAVTAAPVKQWPSMALTTPQDAGKKKRKSGFGSGSDGSKLRRSETSHSLHEATKDEDEDQSLKSSQHAQSKKMSKVQHSKTQVHKYVSKLELNSIINGAKMGVTMRHARDQASLMEVRERLEMNAHLKLAAMAATLAAGEVQKQELGNIHEALDALQGSGQSMQWPASLQLEMWHRVVGPLVTQCQVGTELKNLSELWSLTRPYAVPADKPGLVIKRPQLHLVEASASEKVEYFCDTWVVNSLLPLLLEGEPRQAAVQSLAAHLLGFIEKDLLEDVEGDEYLECLHNLQQLFLILKALLAEDWKELMAWQSVFRRLQKPQKSDVYFNHIANACREVEYYKDKMAHVHNTLLSLTVHEKDIKCLAEFADEEQSGINEAYVKKFEEILKQWCTVVAGVPQVALEELGKEIKNKLQSTWQAFAAGYDAGKKVVVPAVLMQRLLAEAGIAFPQFDWVTGAQEQLSTIMQQVSGTDQMHALENLMSDFFQKFQHHESTMEQLKEVETSLGQATGLLMDAGGQMMFAEYWKIAYKMIAEDETIELTYKTEVTEFLESLVNMLQAHLPEDAEKRVQRLKTFCDVQTAFSAWTGLGESTSARLAKDDEKAKLAEMIRSRKAALLLLPLSEESCAGLQPLVEKVKASIDEARDQVLKQDEEVMKAQIAKATSKAGGGVDGSCWDNGLAGSCSYEKLLEKAQGTVMKVQGLEFESSILEVEQVTLLINQKPQLQHPKGCSLM